MKCFPLVIASIIVAAIVAAAFAAPANDPTVALLPPDRDAFLNWKMAGLLSVGGIPNYTTVCATLAPSGGDDTAAIQAAINNSGCAAGDVISLGAGTYNMNSACVSLNKGVVLRGTGPGVTILSVTNGATLDSYFNGAHNACVLSVGGNATISNTTALASDGAQGAYSVTVADATGFSVGSLVLIDELGIGQAMPDCCFNGGTGEVWAAPDYRVEWNQHNPQVNFFDSACNGFSNNNNFSCGTNGDECAYSIRCGGVNEELHLVTAVNGTTITFDSPLTLSYRTANTAQAHVYSPASIVRYAGVEQLTMTGGDQGNLLFTGCVYCWAKSVESTIWLNGGGFAFYAGAFRDQLDTFWVHNAAWPVSGGGGYAINLTFGTSEDYIVNGISMLANKVIVSRASGAGTVIAYNYMDDGYINGQDTWIEVGLNCSHLVGSHDCLFEGNYSFNTDSDFTHGNSTHNTFFRNYATGFRAPFTALDGTHIDDTTGCCGPQRAVSDHGYGYWDSFIGNIAGMPGHMSGWNYRCAAGNANSGCAPAVFSLGWNDTSVAGSLADGSMAVSYPTQPSSTITGPGCLSTGTNCAPIVDGNYDFLTNAIQWASNDTSHVLPPSFYLGGKPAFFTGQSSIWPPVDPINGVVHNIPAQARWAACQPPSASCMFTQP